MKNLPRNTAGFSLVELLIAAMVVAVAGTLLAAGLLTSNRGAQQRLRQIAATQLLASQLALLDDHVTGVTGELSGTFPPTLEAFHWTQRWEQATGPLNPLAHTTLAVSDGTYTAHAVTYLPIAEGQ